MKKLIFAFVMLAMTAFCAGAQDLSQLSKAARAAYDFLQADGYKPTVDEDNDVVFKAQGISFYIDNYQNDDTYLRVVLTPIEEIDVNNKAQRDAALYACNFISLKKKLLKAYLWEDGTIEFCTSAYIASSGEVSEMVSASIEYMIAAVTPWVDAFNEAIK